VPYQLKTPYKNGTTHVVFEALDVLARLAALVPRPRVNLTRYHGVFAPNSAHRALVTRAGRGKSREGVSRADARTPIERHAAMRWAQRLKRVFSIDIETCAGCGGTMRIIACIEDPAVIEAILAHLAGKARPVHAPRLSPRLVKGSDPFTTLYGKCHVYQPDFSSYALGCGIGIKFSSRG
jgi:hypothetical protein